MHFIHHGTKTSVHEGHPICDYQPGDPKEQVTQAAVQHSVWLTRKPATSDRSVPLQRCSMRMAEVLDLWV